MRKRGAIMELIRLDPVLKVEEDDYTALINYIHEVKPYHTKLGDLIFTYVFEENIDIEIQEQFNTTIDFIINYVPNDITGFDLERYSYNGYDGDAIDFTETRYGIIGGGFGIGYDLAVNPDFPDANYTGAFDDLDVPEKTTDYLDEIFGYHDHVYGIGFDHIGFDMTDDLCLTCCNSYGYGVSLDNSFELKGFDYESQSGNTKKVYNIVMYGYQTAGYDIAHFDGDPAIKKIIPDTPTSVRTRFKEQLIIDASLQIPKGFHFADFELQIYNAETFGGMPYLKNR